MKNTKWGLTVLFFYHLASIGGYAEMPYPYGSPQPPMPSATPKPPEVLNEAIPGVEGVPSCPKLILADAEKVTRMAVMSRNPVRSYPADQSRVLLDTILSYFKWSEEKVEGGGNVQLQTVKSRKHEFDGVYTVKSVYEPRESYDISGRKVIPLANGHSLDKFGRTWRLYQSDVTFSCSSDKWNPDPHINTETKQTCTDCGSMDYTKVVDSKGTETLSVKSSKNAGFELAFNQKTENGTVKEFGVSFSAPPRTFKMDKSGCTYHTPEGGLGSSGLESICRRKLLEFLSLHGGASPFDFSLFQAAESQSFDLVVNRGYVTKP